MKKISAAAHKVLNDPKRLQEKARWFGILDDLLDGKAQENEFLKEYVPTICGYCGRSGFDLSPEKEPLAYSDPESWMVEALEHMADYIATTDEKPWFETFSLEYGIFGVHFIDRIFGNKVFYHPPGEWGAYAMDMEVGSLQTPDVFGSETWKLAEVAAKTFAAQDVALPSFGLPTIASALNIGVNLQGAELLMAMQEEPEAAAHDLKVINDVLIAVHKRFRELLPHEQIKPVGSIHRSLPNGYGQLCGCSTQMLSGQLYADMVAPLDAQLLDVFPKGGMIHLCGSHKQHMQAWADMPQMRVLQVAHIDFEDYFKKSRQDQILYFFPADEKKNEYPCQRLIDMAMEVTGGERMVIMANVPPVRKPKK